MPETLFLTMNVIDRFLEQKAMTRKNLQLVGQSSACRQDMPTSLMLSVIASHCIDMQPQLLMVCMVSVSSCTLCTSHIAVALLATTVPGQAYHLIIEKSLSLLLCRLE